ncbi:hypothetical protein DESC_610065 [Desulfosarcina cetonica]|nr:hypothetical protein DESC_610065 [Desulfosarcina cetonica]
MEPACFCETTHYLKETALHENKTHYHIDSFCDSPSSAVVCPGGERSQRQHCSPGRYQHFSVLLPAI